jgi:hypothetical protein
MAAKKTTRVTVARGGVAAGATVAWNTSKAAQNKPAFAASMPEIPKKTAAPPMNGLVTLAFVGGAVEMEATTAVVVKGGAPTLVEQEYEGRKSMTALDARTLRTATVTVIVTTGGQKVLSELFHRCEQGHVCRMYGPIVGPALQGEVWAFASMPEPEILAPLNPDGTVRGFKLVQELREWNPMVGLTPAPRSRVGSDGPRKRAAAKGEGRDSWSGTLIDDGWMGTLDA